jgi:hypothetical protein
MGIIGILLVLAGPLVTLGIWLWLRSRRDPVALVEPLELGRVLSLGFRIFTPEGWPALLLAALLVGLPQAVSALVTRPMMIARTQQIAALHPASPFAAFEAMMSAPIIVAGIVGFLLMMTYYIATTIFLVSRFEGTPVSIGEALARTPARVLPAFFAILLSLVGIMLGWILFLVPGIVLSLNWILIVPVISCENAGFLGSFARSRSLVTGSRGRIVLLFLLLILVMLLLSLPGMLLARTMVGQMNTSPGLFVVVWQIVFGIAVAAFQSSLLAGLYVELRRIRDGMTAPGLADVFA